MSYNVEPFRIESLAATPAVKLTRFDHPPGARLPSTFSAYEAAEEFRVNVVGAGCFRLKYGRLEWTLGPGSVFLSRPEDEYRYSHVAHVQPDTTFVLGYADSFNTELAELFGRLDLVLPPTNRLAFLIQQLTSEMPNDVTGGLETIASEFVDAACNAGAGSDHLYRANQLKWYAQRIRAARELIDADPAGDHSLRNLANAVSMSPFRFARVFRDLAGIPPHQYLLRARLVRARKLLQTGMSVTDTCYAVGFNNLSHFIRSFRRSFGVIPSAVS
ncbi:MAG TPA: AraC family transcriptional regulator [Gemmatimonadaceae bacterium]|nr:AraC family transcriptional regulator [Gemmatimonadaceae bacterium]